MRHPFVGRLLAAAALTAAALALAPLLSDFGLYPADGRRAFVWLALTVYVLSYLAVLTFTVAVQVALPGLSARRQDHPE